MHVIIVGPASSAFLYFAAGKEMNIKITALTTGEGNLYLSEENRAKIEHLVMVDSLDVNAFVGAACRLNKIDPIDGVLAGDELMVEHASIVADTLGLPFISPDKVGRVRNKAHMRKRLHEANIRAPKFATAGNAIDLEIIGKDIGFPAVIKPLAMAGSVGVARVDNLIELLAAYEDIINDEGGWGSDLGTEVLVEEFLEGTVHVVDGCVRLTGEIDICEFCKYDFGPQPHFQMIGYVVYHEEDLRSSQEMAEYVKDVVRALEIPIGPFHAEVILTPDGPVLVEIANRLPGAHIPEAGASVSGKSLVKYALAAATNQPVEAIDAKARAAGCYYIVSPSEFFGKTYKVLNGWEEIASSPLVDAAAVDIKPGDIIPPHIDERSWIASVRYHANTVTEAEAFRQKLLETVHVSE